MGGPAENPILLDEEEDKENSPPTTQVSERPTQPPALLSSFSFGTGGENVPEYVHRYLFQSVLPCTCFIINYNERVSFYQNLFQSDSDMCETKAVLVSFSLFSLVAESVCICQA